MKILKIINKITSTKDKNRENNIKIPDRLYQKSSTMKTLEFRVNGKTYFRDIRHFAFDEEGNFFIDLHTSFDDNRIKRFYIDDELTEQIIINSNQHLIFIDFDLEKYDRIYSI